MTEEQKKVTPEEAVLTFPQRLRVYASLYQTIDISITSAVAKMLASDLEAGIRLRLEREEKERRNG